MRSHCWSLNTWKTKKSQWKRYMDFCNGFRLTPMPADAETIGLYITHLAKKCCYVTIINYVSAVWALHDHWGVPHIDATTFLISSTLRGAKRLLGCESTPSDPLSPAQMRAIWSQLDMNVYSDLQFWTALCVMYRCLLRVSHVVASAHCMRVKDISWTMEGMDVTIRSSKTIQYRERSVVIPVVSSPASTLCPCGYMSHYLSSSDLEPESPIFPYTYNVFSSKLKKMCVKAGLVGNYTTHSLRRGSATFLSTFLPLHTVRTYGDWKSWAVLLYVSDDYSARKNKDTLVASMLSPY